MNSVQSVKGRFLYDGFCGTRYNTRVDGDWTVVRAYIVLALMGLPVAVSNRNDQSRSPAHVLHFHPPTPAHLPRHPSTAHHPSAAEAQPSWMRFRPLLSRGKDPVIFFGTCTTPCLGQTCHPAPSDLLSLLCIHC